MDIKTNCPFCKGDKDGCCFCDHSGKVVVGENGIFKTMDDLIPFQKEIVMEDDLRKLFSEGGFNHI